MYDAFPTSIKFCFTNDIVILQLIYVYVRDPSVDPAESSKVDLQSRHNSTPFRSEITS